MKEGLDKILFWYGSLCISSELGTSSRENGKALSKRLILAEHETLQTWKVKFKADL